jgi:uncharacterized protein YjbI with pentapeptide repeats
MADDKHMVELEKGVKIWNQWRKQNPEIIPDLKKADLRQYDLTGIDLNRANLIHANLNNANLTSANLKFSILIGTQLGSANLSNANLYRADLKSASLTHIIAMHANLSEANLSGATFLKASLNEVNMRRAILNDTCLSLATLKGAILSRADLNAATIRNANLESADLSGIQALGTNFQGTSFTGACLQDWHINATTILEETQCDFFYQKKGINSKFISRLPNHGKFRLGEFADGFTKSSSMNNLYFHELEDFSHYLHALQAEQSGAVFVVESIRCSNNMQGFSVQIGSGQRNSPEAANQLNAEQLQLARLSHELQMQTQINNMHQRSREDIMEVIKSCSSNSTRINLEANIMSTPQITNNLQGSNIGNFANEVKDNAKQQANQYNSAANRNLTDAAKEIQILLEQLSQIYSTETMPDKVAFAHTALQQIKANPSLSQKVLSAAAAGSSAAIEKLLDHPAATFVVSAIEDWRKEK